MVIAETILKPIAEADVPGITFSESARLLERAKSNFPHYPRLLYDQVLLPSQFLNQSFSEWVWDVFSAL